MPADILALFDLDHTLLPYDSDQQWVTFLIEERLLDGARYRSTNEELIKRYNRGEAAGRDFTESYLSSLTVFDALQVSDLRARFVAQIIRPRIGERAQAMVDRHLEAGDVVAITTAVIAFLAVAIAAEFGVDQVIGTEGEQIDGRYPGRIVGVVNSREGKVERLHAWLAARGQGLRDYRDVWACCDSLNDLPLLSQASHPVAVNADPVLAAHARHQGWQIVQFA